jgi:uncharacterized protein YerC
VSSVKDIYRIAKEVTGGDELSNDLAHYVYEIVIQQQNIRDFNGYFASACAFHWFTIDSSFNKLYDRFRTVELYEYVLESDEDIVPNDKYLQFLREYISTKAEDHEDFVRKEVAKLVIQGKTYRQIEKEVKINISYVHAIISEFRDCAFNAFIERVTSVNNKQ